MPLAMPAYIIAITYVGIIDNFNFLPDIRNLFGAIIMISLVLYPYVYILARGAFLEQSKELYESSQILGASQLKNIFKYINTYGKTSYYFGGYFGCYGSTC